jgi:hypothetical protein
MKQFLIALALTLAVVTATYVVIGPTAPIVVADDGHALTRPF